MPSRIIGIRFEELVAVKQFYAVYLMEYHKQKLAGSGAAFGGYIPKANMTGDDYLYLFSRTSDRR